MASLNLNSEPNAITNYVLDAISYAPDTISYKSSDSVLQSRSGVGSQSTDEAEAMQPGLILEESSLHPVYGRGGYPHGRDWAPISPADISNESGTIP